MAKIYIFGHRNPDTDSVAAAISLSYLKNQLGMNTVPAVLSSVNKESKFALNYFGVKEPLFLNDVKIKIKDLNYTKKYEITDKDSINDAYYKMTEAGISKIPVVDESKKIKGIVTMNDIAKEQFSDNIDYINSSYEHILKALNGESLLHYNDEIKGNLTVASYRSTTILNTIKFNQDSILIVGDRHSVIEYAINSGIKLLIVAGGHQIKEHHLELAREKKVNIIITPYNTLIASRKINLANIIATIPYKKEILCVKEHDAVSDFIKLSNKTRYSYYPVITEKGMCVGILRVSDVTYENKKKVILVDHNSYEQSAIGLEETEIVEIVDHHNISGIGTKSPINFRNMPLGSTNTIIYILYKENNIAIPKHIAGLMLSGILSDTLILTSPTTTDIDRKIVEDLAVIAEVNYKEYGLAMLKAGSSLKGKTKEEVLYTDYKNYPIGDEKIGLGQLSTTSPEEILEEKEEYIKLLNEVSDGNNYFFVAFFITDIINNGSYVLYSKRGEDILKRAYHDDKLVQGTFLKDVVSRKKQILPNIMIEMEDSASL